MSYRRRRDSFWRQEAGGAPFWFLAAALVLVMVGGAWALVYSSASQSEASQTRRTLAPIPTFGDQSAPPPRAVFIGDSFTEASQVVDEERFPTLVAEHFGWSVENRAEGGTGYITDGPAEFPEREPLTGQVERVVAAAPEIVFISGGLNDTSRDYSEDEIRGAVRTTLSGVRTGLPEASIYVVGPFWPRGNPIPEAVAMRDIVREEADALGLPFLDPIGGEWVNRDPALIGPDGTHPTTAGQAAIAQRLIDELTGLGVTAN